MTNVEYLLICGSIGILASLNPFLISMFLSKISADFGQYREKSKIIISVGLYLAGFILGALAFSALSYAALASLNGKSLYMLIVIIALVAINIGLLKIASYFWRRTLLVIPYRVESYIHLLSTKKNNYFNSFFLGLISILLLLPSTGLLIILLNSLLIVTDVPGAGWALVFTVGASLLIIGLAIITISKSRISALVKWKEDSKLTMLLYAGLLEIIVSWVLIAQLAGV